MEIRIYEHDGKQHNYVLRSDIIDEIINATADEVDKCVTRDWNDGLIKKWLASDLHCAIALKDELPDQVESVGYNCSINEETQAIIDEHESTCGEHGHNWGVIGCAEDYVVLSDIDRYACKVWDWCEEGVYEALEREHNMHIIHDESELVETFC